jgi:hypothetical protein
MVREGVVREAGGTSHEPPPELRSGLAGRFNAEPIIHSVPESLFASEVLFRRLHGYMTQQELDLLQLTSRIVAESSTRPPPMPGPA